MDIFIRFRERYSECIREIKALNWEMLDLPTSPEGIEEVFIPLYIEKLTQCIEINMALVSKDKYNGLKERTRITYNTFHLQDERLKKVDTQIDGLTYDLVATDRRGNLRKVEWKNPYKFSDSEASQYGDSFWFRTDIRYPDAVMRWIPMTSNVVKHIEMTWGNQVPEQVAKFIPDLVSLAREIRSENEKVEMTENDITTDFMMKLMAESGGLSDELNYKVEYPNLIGEKTENKKEIILEEVLKASKIAYEFGKKHAEEPANIKRFIPLNENGISSFNRDDDRVNHSRLPKLITTLPDRDFIPMKEWESEGTEVFKYFDSFTKVFPDGRTKEIKYEIGAEETLRRMFSNLERVEEHYRTLREYNLVFALNTSLKRADNEAILESVENFRMQTELDPSGVDELLKVLTDSKLGKEARIEVLTNYLKGIGERFTEDTDILVDGAGEMKLNNASRKMDTKRKTQTAESRTKVKALIMDYEPRIEAELFHETHEQGIETEWDFMKNLNAYSHNGLNSISRHLLKVGSERLEEIYDSKYYGIAHQQMNFYKNVLAGGNVGKSVSTNGFRIIHHKERGGGFYTLKTNDTSKLTTGTMWNFGAYLKREGDSNTFPHIYGDYEYLETENVVYFCSKPYTMSIPVLEKPFFALSSWIATMLAMTEEMRSSERIEFLNENVILHSLFWDYNANIRHVLTVINFMYKLPLASGFFGKFEMEGRLDKYVVRDARMATIYHRLYQNWEGFIKEYRDKKAERPNAKVSELLNGIKDPLFGFNHTSALTLNNVGFLKNILLKDDGVDELKFLSAQYQVEKEHYTKDYLESEVVRLWDSYQKGDKDWESFDVQFKEFMGCLFKNEGEKPKWAAVSFYPEVIDVMTNDLYDEIESKNPNIKKDVRRWVDEHAIASEKQSKVNLFDSAYTEELMKDYLKENNLPEMDLKEDEFVKYCAKKGALVGVRSFDLPTAMKLEIKRMADFLHDVTPRERPFYLFNKGPKLLHLAMFGLLKYKKSCIVTEHMKKQVGELRVFFMQELSMRNGNRIIDKMHSAILAKVKEDLITKKGDRKLIEIERMSQIIRRFLPNTMFIACDQKRYGDTYPMESLLIKLNTLLERGYITRDEYMIFKKCLLLIKNRYVLIHPKIRNFIDKIEAKKIDPLVSLSNNSRKIVEDLKVIFADKIDAADFNSYKDHELMMLITKNKGLKKGVGWILGVMNMFSSVDTTLHLKTMLDCVKHLILGDPIVTGGTHSDDEIIVTGLPTLSYAEYIGKNRLINDMSEIISEKDKFIIDENGMRSTTTKREYTLKEVSGLIITLSILTPRFYGQRPSLAKWVWGDSGEVLQTTVQGESSTQPISKWITVFSRELPFESPGSDLQHMIAQVIPSLKHGASEELMATCFILVNQTLNWIYPDIKRAIDIPPEIGGYWWCVPSIVKETGFASNEVRLYTLSDYSRNIIKIMSKTSPLWNFNKIEDSQKEYEVHSRVDLKIVFSTYTTTDKNIQELVKRLNLEDRLEEMGMNDFYANLKAYNSETKASRLKQGKNVETNTINYITRAFSPSFQRKMFKVKASKALIATLGYNNRKFKNVFKEEIFDSPLMTFAEWKEIVLQESQVTTFSDKTINLFEKIYQSDIITHTNFPIDSFKIRNYSEPKYGWLFNLKYKEVRASKEGYYPDFAKAVILCCHDIMDSLNPHNNLMTRIRETETYLYNQEVCEEGGFETAVATWIDNFRQLNLKSNDLIEVYDFLVGVLSSTYALDILKRENGNTHVLIDSFQNMMSSFYGLVFDADKFNIINQNNSDLSKEVTLDKLLSSQNAKDLINTSEDVDRILSITSWVKEINKVNSDGIRITVGDTMELTERELVQNYRNVTLDKLGDGLFKHDRDYETNSIRNKFLLRELVLSSLKRETETFNLIFHRGALMMKRTFSSKKREKLMIFTVTVMNRYHVQLVFENYRDEDVGKMQCWIFFANITEKGGIPTEKDYKSLPPIIELINYYMISDRNRVWIKSPNVVYNSAWDRTRNERVFKWPEGYSRLPNSGNNALNIHSGTLVSPNQLQRAKKQENGYLFTNYYKAINIDSKEGEVEQWKSVVLSSYLITPWTGRERELNVKIMTKDTSVLLFSDYGKIASKTEPLVTLREKLIKLFPNIIGKDSNEPVQYLLSLLCIIDNYICNVEILEALTSINVTGTFEDSPCIIKMLPKQIKSLTHDIKMAAKEASKTNHNDTNSYKLFIKGIEIIRVFRTQLGELSCPSSDEMKSLKAEDRETLEDILPKTLALPETSSLRLLFMGPEIGASSEYILEDGEQMKRVSGKLGLFRPKVMLTNMKNYLKLLYKPEIGDTEEEDKDHKKIFLLQSTRGNLKMKLLNDLLIGFSTRSESTTILKYIASSDGMAWCRTKVRVSSVLVKIIEDLDDDSELLKKMIGLIEIMKFS